MTDTLNARPNHILIVEDDEMIRSFLALHLESSGFQTSAVECGIDMFQALEEESIDLILLDLNLPDGDGLDFAHEVRQHLGTPIIIASARTALEDRLAALNLGAIDYMMKPFEPEELMLRIRNMLELSGQKTARPVPGITKVFPGRTPGISLPKMLIGSAALAATIVVSASAGLYFGIYGANSTATASAPAPAPVQQAAVTPRPSISQFETAAGGESIAPVKPADQQTAKPQVTQNQQPQPRQVTTSPQLKFQPPTVPTTTAQPATVASLPKCDPIPDVAWWNFKSHNSIKRYVSRKFQGDWGNYKKSWEGRLSRLQDIHERGSRAVASSGDILEGDNLLAYIKQVEKRLEIIDCLAERTS